MGAVETEAEAKAEQDQDQGEDAEGGGVRSRGGPGRRRRTEGGALQPSHQPSCGVLYSRYSWSSGPADRASPSLGILNFSGSSVSTHRLLASNQIALRPRHLSPRSESTTPSRTRPRKQPREAATLGWECRSQQVRRSRVSGAHRES